MILHPGILALIVGSCIAFAMILYACALGIRVVARWDDQSNSQEQLTLERKTYLISTMINYALGFEIISAFLFIYTLEDIHTLFVGAMCGTGSLNANPVGWYVLYTKIILFFASCLWVALNYFDQRAEDYPLVKPKYVALLFVTPLAGLDLTLQLQYFSGLQPEIITSCCGSLFSEEGTGLASDLATLPVIPAMWGFYGTALLFWVTAALCLVKPASVLRTLLSGVAALWLFVSIAAILSFISLYIYELPTHHCPFDILQKNYGFVGYPIYISLFCAVLFGLLPGAFQPLKKIPTLSGRIREAEKRWLVLALISMFVFVALCSWPVLFGNLTMIGYS